VKIRQAKEYALAQGLTEEQAQAVWKRFRERFTKPKIDPIEKKLIPTGIIANPDWLEMWGKWVRGEAEAMKHSNGEYDPCAPLMSDTPAARKRIADGLNELFQEIVKHATAPFAKPQRKRYDPIDLQEPPSDPPQISAEALAIFKRADGEQ
jgi:hypothetical protein